MSRAFGLRWSPREDITTHELALAVGLMFAHQRAMMLDGDVGPLARGYDALPDNAKRHFEKIPATEAESKFFIGACGLVTA